MKLENIDCGKAYDWGFTSEQYAKYRDIYPDKLYEKLRALGVAADGTAWLDLGTGTGVLIQNLYNKNARITGVDITEEQIRFARETAKENGFEVDYLVSPAESTNLPDGSFDTITAAQCFSYFERDKMKAEVKRLLKPGGKLIKIYMDWCLDDEIAEKSVSLVKEYNPDWTGKMGIEEDIYDDLFAGRKTEEFYCDIAFTREGWHGRMCACRGTLASMSKEQFEKWSRSHLKMLSSYPESFTVKHKIYITYFVL